MYDTNEITAAPVQAQLHGKRAAVHTLGCRLNQSESNLLHNALRAAGYELVPFDEPADLGIINTCTVTREADAKSRQLVRRFVRRNPDAFTAVIGCYSHMGYKTLAEIPGVDLIVGNQEKLNVLDYVAQGKRNEPLIVRDRMERDDFTIEIGVGESATNRPNLKIQDGCNFMCSFCVIPFARGRTRSRELGDLVREAEQLAANGARELVLTGVNIGAYAYEGRGIVDVVDALDAIPGVARVRISSIEPTTIPEALLERMAAPGHALVPYLHIPLQSGSDRVLTLMKRKYSRREFVGFVENAARRVPDLCIGTDVLAGMPGETDEDFEETAAVLRDGPMTYAHVFKYSERPGTPTARYADKVDEPTKNRRAALLRALSAEKRMAYIDRYLGRRVMVLFEEEDDGCWPGYTGNYIRVAVRSSEQLLNQLRPVWLTERRGDIMMGILDDDE